MGREDEGGGCRGMEEDIGCGVMKKHAILSIVILALSGVVLSACSWHPETWGECLIGIIVDFLLSLSVINIFIGILKPLILWNPNLGCINPLIL
ncbi:MAG TPA: hypothetical protein EYP86_05385, partial [Candidatus Altiarchaeales archaeon]|nr:hypothetical protein [Candidatus Altiarchaeales archaeon]